MLARARQAVSAATILIGLAGPVAAHETQPAGGLRVTVGWAEEPAYAGLKNAVEVSLTDAAGVPVGDLGGSLDVAVSFGGEQQVLALQPAGRPGTFTAPLVPTRAGTYTFHVTGTAKGQAVDVTSTCSEQTFDCVADVAEVQFPARDPSTGQVAERVVRESRRVDRAHDAASTARLLAAAAVVLASVAVAVAFGVGRRRSAPRD